MSRETYNSITATSDRLIAPGVAIETKSAYTTLPEDGSLYVPMNAARHTRVPIGQDARVYTVGLAGCTGIAAVAECDGDRLAGVSHFDPAVEARQRENGVCPSETFIHTFTRVARHLGAQSMHFLVAYDETQKRDPAYIFQNAHANYADWHFLDQLESLADDNEPGVTIVYQPYQGMQQGHELAITIHHATADIQLSGGALNATLSVSS